MARTISIGAQSFEELRRRGCFYVDKTSLIREWWSGEDDVTLIYRPRRFGKTLNLSMLNCFFSTAYANRGKELFGGLFVWDDPKYRAIQGTIPVVSISFARVKQRKLDMALSTMRRILRVAIDAHDYLRESPVLTKGDRAFLAQVSDSMNDSVAADCLNQLCSMLYRHWGVKPIVLMDEYDTPMQEAWLNGYWNEMVSFQRSLFNATFKSNDSLDRAIITGVTRVSRESIFSDLNNLTVVTTSSQLYATSFGFTEGEVFRSLDEYGLLEEKELVKEWYDGFTFGGVPDIYNPWSITKFLEDRRFDTYWANTSSNSLVSSLVRRGNQELKEDFQVLLTGGSVTKEIDEQVVFNDLGRKPNAIWALLLSGGYVKAEGQVPKFLHEPRTLSLTNYEVRLSFDAMIKQWFGEAGDEYNRFVRALLAGDLRAMNAYLHDVVLDCASSFDTGTKPSRSQPERFYHGLVLGLLVDLRGRYAVESNRESGFGRYDVALVPLGNEDPAVILEFKVLDSYDGEQVLEDTVANAHAQIEKRAYAAGLVARGIAQDRIRTYGIAFRGKEVLVG